jgi:hypothetical protein
MSSTGRCDLLPPCYTWTDGNTTYTDGGLKLSDLESVLKELGAIGPSDDVLTLPGTTEVRRWSYDQLLTAARSIGC